MKAEDAPSRPSDETLDLLFDLTRHSPDRQLASGQAVDAKTFQAFAAGGVLIGLAAIRGVHQDNVVIAFLALAVAAFLVVAVFSVIGLWSRRFWVVMGADQLWEDYWPDSPADIKWAFVADTAKGYLKNDRHLKNKHRLFRVVLIALVIEAAAIGAALIASAVTAEPAAAATSSRCCLPHPAPRMSGAQVSAEVGAVVTTNGRRKG